MIPQPSIDIDLQFERTDDGYFTRLLESPVGPTSAPFRSPFGRRDIETFWQQFVPSVSSLNAVPSARLQEVKSLGSLLFATVFQDALETAWRMSREQAIAQQAALRVRLDFANVPELAIFPWEMLFDPERGEFLSMAHGGSLTRFTRLRHHIAPEPPPAPLRALVVLPRPSSFPGLNADRAWIELLDTIDYLGADGKLVVERLQRPTLLDLQRKLRQNSYHIFHFMGHTVFDKHTADGQFVFEDEMGRSRLIAGEHLGALLRDHHALRLVCLSGLEGVVFQPERSPYLAAAEQLLRKGMAAVIAPRFETPQVAQLAFYNRLYATLTELAPIDLAVAEARRAMDEEVGGAAWAAPTLFTRVADGVLFDDGRYTQKELSPEVQESIQYRLNSLRIRSANWETMARWNSDVSETRRRPGGA
jgi:hypothetical protein